jgi:hypothetical protein
MHKGYMIAVIQEYDGHNGYIGYIGYNDNDNDNESDNYSTVSTCISSTWPECTLSSEGTSSSLSSTSC